MAPEDVNRTRLTLTALVLLTLGACGTQRTIDTAHVATIACAADGEVHAQASQYAGGSYTLNGGAPVAFGAGFDLTLDGATTWTLVVTADDGFPTFTGQAGPCRTPSSSGSSTTFPTPATFGFPGGTTTTTTTSPPVPATFAAPGGTTTTTTVVDSTTTTAAPPVTTAVVSSTTVVPTTACPTCTAPPPPPAGLPATLGIGVNAWLGAALLVVLIAILGWACYRRHA